MLLDRMAAGHRQLERDGDAGCSECGIAFQYVDHAATHPGRGLPVRGHEHGDSHRHLGWTSAWYGAARGALDRYVKLLRNESRERRRLSSDLFWPCLADIRLSLDLLESMLSRLIDIYERMRAGGAPASAYEMEWTIPLNGLKVAGSRMSFEAVGSLVELAGLARRLSLRRRPGHRKGLWDLRARPA